MPDHLDDFAVPVDVEARYRVAARDACVAPDLNDDCWFGEEPSPRPHILEAP